MAVGPLGQFDYRATLKRTDAGFAGRALPSAAERLHPGIVGQQPTIELREGTIILRRGWIDRLAGRVRYKGRFRTPLSSVSLSAGELLHRVALDGDVLRLCRGGTGDVGLTLMRSGELLVGVGAAAGMLPGISIEDDPRIPTTALQLLRPVLLDPRTRFVWLDTASTTEGQEPPLDSMAGETVVVAVAGGDVERRRAVLHRLSTRGTDQGQASTSYVDVSERFTTLDEWLAYVRRLPNRRPSDPYVRFTFADGYVDVGEGHGAFARPWHLFVNRVYEPGIPGALSTVGVVREHPEVDSETVEDATIGVSDGMFDFAP